MVFVSAETGRLEANQIKPSAALKRNMSPVIVVLVYESVRTGIAYDHSFMPLDPRRYLCCRYLCNRKPVGKLVVTPMAASDTVR